MEVKRSDIEQALEALAENRAALTEAETHLNKLYVERGHLIVAAIGVRAKYKEIAKSAQVSMQRVTKIKSDYSADVSSNHL